MTSTLIARSLAPEPPALTRRLDQMVTLAARGTDEAIGVAGPGAADAMCGLWRRGYQRVEAARRCTCGCADQACAALFVMGGSDAEEVAALIDAVSPMLQPGGRLVLTMHDFSGMGERIRLANRLANRGFRYIGDALYDSILLAIKAEDATARASA